MRHWLRAVRWAGQSVLWLAAAGFFVSAAFAQQNLPGTVEPGLLQRQFRPPTEPRGTVETIVPAAPRERVLPENARAIRFTLSAVTITGATVYPQSAFVPFYRADLGKQISLADLYAVADAITTKYRNDGYILSRAYVPPQTIRGGTARIAVVEGYVDKVEIRGAKGRPDLFNTWAADIKASRPLRLPVLERYLLLAGDLAGAAVQSVFRPSGQSGASTLIVTIDNKPVDAQLELNNRGTRFLGPLQLNVAGGVNNLFGLYGRSAFNFVTTPQNVGELQYYHFQQEETLDSEGTKIVAALSYVRSNPGSFLAPLDIQGRDTAASVTISHPFIRSRPQNLYGALAFSFENARTEELSAPAANDRIRSFVASGSYELADPWRGDSQFAAELTQGLPILGATPDRNPFASRINGRTEFTKIDLRASRKQQLFDRFSLVVLGAGQISPDSLLASQQFAFGGEPFGRAYDFAELTGDQGVAGSVELRYSPDIPQKVLNSSEVFTYYDIGEVFNHVHPGLPASLSAASAGFGLRLSVTPFLIGSAEVDKPLTRPVAAEGNKDWRVFFRLVARY